MQQRGRRQILGFRRDSVCERLYFKHVSTESPYTVGATRIQTGLRCSCSSTRSASTGCNADSRPLGAPFSREYTGKQIFECERIPQILGNGQRSPLQRIPDPFFALPLPVVRFLSEKVWPGDEARNILTLKLFLVF